MSSLTGKKAFITGAAAGIGLAIAKKLIAAGAQVIITDMADGTAAAKEIGASFYQLNVTDEKQVKQVLDTIAEKHGKLDIMINNAGIAPDLPSLEEAPEGIMEKIMAVNCFGVYYAIKHGAKHMNDGGSIINMGSAAGSGLTAPGHAEYSASKAGVGYISRTAAIELGPRGIRVNAVCPAGIAGTGMTSEDDGGPVANFYRNLTVLGRMGTPDEVADLYCFLASDASTFITGQEIRIDGGMTAGVSLGVAGNIMG